MTWSKYRRRQLLAGCALAVLLTGALIDLPRQLAARAFGSDDTAHAAACLPGVAVPVMDSPHVSEVEVAATTYNSTPPTSGPHLSFPQAPGIYDSPISNGLLVHALEHGHVGVLYAPSTPPDTVSRLRALAKRFAGDVVLAPHPALPSGVAAVAWGRVDQADTFDDSRVARFVEELRNRYDHGWRGPDPC
ncbi:MAG TPA: DUF3105 domain-containing protein [Actinokineospora sp.]|jgi:hypothetical protein|nr:DUF3105 domain-containing protein [Actinokineospora sp.]